MRRLAAKGQQISFTGWFKRCFAAMASAASDRTGSKSGKFLIEEGDPTVAACVELVLEDQSTPSDEAIITVSGQGPASQFPSFRRYFSLVRLIRCPHSE